MTEPASPAEATPPPRVSTRAFTIGALITAALLACVASLWASAQPDGLEFVAESSGFLGTAQDGVAAAGPFAGYGAVFVSNPWLSVATAGMIGCTVTFGAAWLVGRVARRRVADE